MFGNFTVYAGRTYMSETAAHSDFSVYRRHRSLLTYLLTYLLLLVIYSPSTVVDGFSMRSSNA